LVVRQDLNMPSPMVMTQLFLLTTAHAALMVSAAIVISVQSTSVKAANLLASFIVIPVALLMQGEAVLLFWGNERVLWLAIAGVLIISMLLIRVGIAHFEREYLLGREIDVINLRWIWKTFWANFMGGAKSFWGWYGGVFLSMRRIAPAVLAVTLVALVSLWLGYDWIMVNVSDVIHRATPERLQKIEASIDQLPDLTNMGDSINAPFLFINNTRAVALIFVLGLFSFGVLGILLYMLNIGIIGGLYALIELLGMNPLPMFVAGVLPHGIFELPALMIGSAVALYIGAALVTPQTGKSMGEVLIELLADWVKIFLGIVIPLLAVAAVIEAYVTPGLLIGVMTK
jgi:uncharacterized membrane protein SpoIIM required for sporulation